MTLHESEAQLRLALDAGQVGTYDWDVPSDRFVWSRRHAALWDAPHDTLEVTFEAFARSVHVEDLSGLRAALARAIALREPFVHTFRVVWRDGSVHDVVCRGALEFDAVGRPLRMRGAVLETSAPSDADARSARNAAHEREGETARLSRLYAAMSHVSQVIVWTPARDELFAKVCRALVEHGRFRMAWIGWHDAETAELVPVAQHGDTDGYLERVEVFVDDRPEGRGPSGRAFRDGRPYVSSSVRDDPATLPWRAELDRLGFRASAAFPIRENGEVRGVLSVYSDEPALFRDEEIALLAEAARDLSFALDGLARDVARREAEQTLRQERDFSDAVLNSLPGVLYLYDESGTFLRWNKNFERVTGYSADEIAHMTPLDFFTPAQSAMVAARVEEVFERGESSVEAGFVSKDGRVTPYHLTGVTTQLGGKTCLVGVGIDVSERTRAEAARKESEGRYRTLFDCAPDGIVIADPESVYLDANPSLCRMLGYPHHELVGLHASDIVVATEAARVGPALDEIKSSTEYHREWTFRRRHGSTFSAEVIATVMPDGNLLGMIRDITERKEAERTLRALNDSLEQRVVERTEALHAAMVRAEAADRLKSAFLATMSHELRTPLNSIIGFTGIVHQGLAGPVNEEQKKQLGMVRTSARHLLALINDVLDISKIEAGQLEIRAETFDLAVSLAQVVESVRPLADKKKIALDVLLAPELAEMVSDRRRVEQILLNLLNNAIKFTEHGRVTLVAALEHTPGPTLRVSVTDTGIGIRSSDMATLFQPFRQLDSGLTRQHEGTGLGLAICRRLATLLGGEITGESAWAQGSTFSVTLPLTRARKGGGDP